MPDESAAFYWPVAPWIPTPPYTVPPIHPVGAIRQVTLKFTLGNRVNHNVFYVLTPGEVLTPAQKTFFHEAFRVWWSSSLIGNVPPVDFYASSGSLLLALIHLLPSKLPFQAIFEDTIGLFLTGGAPHPALPQGTTCAVQWVTGLQGPRYRGRTFVCGLVVDAVDPDDCGHLRPTVATDLAFSYSALVKLFSDRAFDTGEAWALVLNHRDFLVQNNPFTRPVTVIRGARMADNVFDSQWRRLPKHHRHKENP